LNLYPKSILRYLSTASASAIVLGLAASAQEAPIVQPGAPGEAVRALTVNEATQIANNTFSENDVVFMQNMIPHHSQAVELANLVEDRTNTPELIEIAGRIKASQSDEIKFMRDWLTERDQSAPGATDGHAGHGAHVGHGGGHRML